MLLIMIYAAFISLGLPDSLLGSAWPVMRLQLGAPVSFAGVVSMIIAGGTIVSSLLSDRLTHKLGTGMVTAASVLLTAVALLGFSLSSATWMLCLWAVPYGLGAGAVDAALNNYVAVHYSSRHMSWLHCCWGVGAAISPFIMSYCLSGGLGWQTGYRSISVIQFLLTALLFGSLPLWKRSYGHPQETGEAHRAKTIPQMLRIPGVPYVLLTFFGYCAMETTAGLWASSYLVTARGIGPETAAQFAFLFYLGITVGRFFNGFAAGRFSDRAMIRVGLGVILASLAAMLLPFKNNTVALVSLLMVGVGCAPIYPSIIHSTPGNFGPENSQAIIGVQMASAYIGSTLVPPLFGVIAQRVDIGLYPAYLLVFAVLMLVMSERLNRAVATAGAADARKEL